MLLELEAMQYDINDIVLEQKELRKEYNKKLKEIKLC